jgi:hypothetical protein
MLKRKNNIVFIEDVHKYYVDNVEVPSVTTILGSTIFKSKYSAVPPFVLQRAADFGSKVHRAIETHDIDGLNDNHIQRVIDYVNLVKTHKITELEHETLLAFNYDYAGTMDLLIEIDGEKALADIKTTSKLDLDYLSWQLSFYARAIDFKGKLYAFWIPNKRYGSPAFVEVERKSDDEIDKVLQEYKEIEK